MQLDPFGSRKRRNSRLTKEQVWAIRRCYDLGKYTQKEGGKTFGISANFYGKIGQRKAYFQHPPEPGYKQDPYA